MGKKGGATRVKRQMAPTFWNIRRKESQFVMRVKPGPHPKNSAYPLGMVLRDAIKVTHTAKESQLILNEGKVKVDGTVRRDPNLAVGLMDVVELANGQAYRLVPKDSELLAPVAVEDAEKAVKLAKITSKVTTKGKKLQYGFHDGKTLLADAKMKVGDTCVLELPGAKVKDHIKFEKGATALIITGENAGKVGKIEDLREGIFSLPTRALVSVGDRTVELPVEMVMVVGKDKPVIKVN
ncbi:ribosomal protein S4E [Candidatus Nitrososphaera evergladensis SR1]|jgi:small subunit ribosomal protein S4e|uniref:Small ribosomal subunit protein eS4 n=1 Tax=Candidatus Nitrososphaera evergladensis SR1 TaxID=1459636 RepID=A0A075MS05_9ARCH|nr:30S ribosomal protein S4e [Candidatus Nitrososphaera evergladensis]AIF83885.1 ribosomal protein S4E [Candidatus Nitrososphaera evergladensis SR1]